MYEGISHVVYVSTNISRGCQAENCPVADHRFLNEDPSFDKWLNHYIGQNGYRLLHVGQESERVDGEMHHHTVAVLGKPEESGD